MIFQFIYRGKYDCIINKNVFELYIKTLYNSIRKRLNVKFLPNKFIITMIMNPNKQKGWGGKTDNAIYDIFKLELQLYGYPKKLQTFEILQRFFGDIVRHEIFHFFIPYIENNSCWSEGVTDFMTFWYNGTINKKLKEYLDEYKLITDKTYKEHKYGYICGFQKMTKLFNNDHLIINDMMRIIQDFNKDRKKKYTKNDIISYNNKFKIFFTKKCNEHIMHIL